MKFCTQPAAFEVPSRMSSSVHPLPASAAGLEAGPRPTLMPFQGSFQLTFFNQFQLEATSVVDLFAKYGNIKEGSKVYSGLKRRCYIHYGTEEEALAALQGLKECKVLHNLDIAPDCVRLVRRTENSEPVDVEIVPCLGTFDLTFTTNRYVDTATVKQMFNRFGDVTSVQSGFRPVRGRTRVFVKFRFRSGAVAALQFLRSTLPDLAVAKNCAPSKQQNGCGGEDPGQDGFYCVRFKNCDPSGVKILERREVIELFNEFGAVQSVYADLKKWCYVRYKLREEAVTAVHELQSSGHLPCVGFARGKDAPTVQRKRIKNSPPESALELLICNYPHTLTRAELRRFLGGVGSLQLREMVVEGTKAYAFARVGSEQDLKLGVRLYHNTRLRGRQVKVMAKLPTIQARIMEELDKEQSCTLNLQTESRNIPEMPAVPADNGSSSDEAWSDDDFLNGYDRDKETENLTNVLEELSSNDVTRTVTMSNIPEQMSKKTETSNNVEVVVANFSGSTTKDDIKNLLVDFPVEKIDVIVTEATESEPFTFAIVRFRTVREALEAVDRFDGSTALGSDALVLELNQ